MLSATIGAASSALHTGAAAKPQIQEQHFNSTSAEVEDAPVDKGTSAPAVPATNSAPLSVEAVTALQQVPDDTAVADQRGDVATVDNELQANLLVPQSEDTDGVAAATVQVEELEQEATESRLAAESEIAVGEETDAAGRSALNPIDLQI
ncbi:MAG: hypothetical protein V7727_10950 [Sneathiella sp.]